MNNVSPAAISSDWGDAPGWENKYKTSVQELRWSKQPAYNSHSLLNDSDVNMSVKISVKPIHDDT